MWCLPLAAAPCTQEAAAAPCAQESAAAPCAQEAVAAPCAQEAAGAVAARKQEADLVVAGLAAQEARPLAAEETKTQQA